jgi:hypothetical protein
VSGRSWIILTLLDLQASDAEVEAAAGAATPGELESVLEGEAIGRGR